MRTTCLLALLLGPTVLACAHPQAAHAPQPASASAQADVRAVLDDWHAAAAEADEDRYFGHFAPEGVFLGTDASEHWDVAAFRQYAHPHFEKGEAWSFHSTRRSVWLSPDGDTAWFDEDLETENLGPARGSGVLVRDPEGHWRIAHYNLALTIPNERFADVRAVLDGEAAQKAEHGATLETGAHEEVHAGAYQHAGHTPHRFQDAEKWAARFERSERVRWQKPEVVIAALKLDADDVVADIGSASGFFPVRIAPKVPDGRVWGVDVEPDMVRYLNARARREGLSNLHSILASPSDPLLPEAADAVLIVNTYHHLSDRPAYFRGLARYLQQDARVVIVDFKMGEQPMGPPDAMKIAPADIQKEMSEAGFTLAERDDTSLPYQHILTFTRD